MSCEGPYRSKAAELSCGKEREKWGIDTVRQWRILLHVEFIETPTFTRLVGKLMDDDDYAKLQLALVLRPDWARSYRVAAVFENCVGREAGVASAAACESFTTGRPLTTRFGCWSSIRRASGMICRATKSEN